MELWNQLTSTAILGTERQPLVLPAQDGPLGAMLGKLVGQDAEHTLLGAAAAVSLYRRVGHVPAALTGEAPTPCADDPRPACGAQAREVLALILTRNDPGLLHEWLTLAAAAGVRVPEAMIPAVLAMGNAEPDLHLRIARSVGARGAWLARQHHDWAYAVVETGAWADAPLETRVTTLRALRSTDPAQARALLMGTSTNERARDLAALLNTFSVSLSMDDEPFLEAMVHEKRKEVRSVASTLLGTLPESRYAARMFERVSELLTFTPAKRGALLRAPVPAAITVTPPETCDKEMMRDGIRDGEPPHPYITGRGAKGWWMQQMLAAVPPKRWTALWQQTPEEIIAASHGLWQEVLLMGWVQAAFRYRDADWARCLFPFAVADGYKGQLFAPLLASAPSGLVDKAVCEKFQTAGQNGPALNEVLQRLPRPWSAERSRAFVQELSRVSQTAAVHDHRPNSACTILLSALPPCAAFVHPVVFNEIAHCLDRVTGIVANQVDQYYVRHVSQAQEILEIRMQLHQAFPAVGAAGGL